MPKLPLNLMVVTRCPASSDEHCFTHERLSLRAVEGVCSLHTRALAAVGGPQQHGGRRRPS